MVNPKNFVHSRYVTQTTPAQAAAFVEDSVALFDNFDGFNPAAPLIDAHNEFINRQMICICVIRGTMQLSVNGQPCVLERNNVHYIGPRSVIRIVSATDDFYYFLYSLSLPLLRNIFADMGVVFHMPSRYKSFARKAISSEEMKYRLVLYNEQRRDLALTTSEANRRIVAQVYQTATCAYDIDIFEPELPDNEQAISRQNKLFRQFVDLLGEHSQRQREVQFYAHQLGITPKYLSSLCIEYSGKNASAWIDDYVISRVKNLMQEHRYSIKEIAQLMNFPTQSFFGRYFKRIVGCSPRAFLTGQ